MNTAYIATAVAIRDLKCFSLETIGDRILLQKKVYLAQDKGLPLGYGYSWYIHGPYSSDLTNVAYQVIPEGEAAIENMSLKARYSTIINNVNELENIITDGNLQIGVVEWYELICSVAYWYKHGYNEDENLIKKMREKKPQFSKELVEQGIKAYMDFRNN